MVSGPREGSRWAHYEIRHEIARGNMGVVFRALDTKTSRDVALKLLVAGIDDPDAAERFKREAKSLARLSHPNVVGVHSYGVQDGLPFMAMDFVPGTTLHELLERGALTTSRAVALLADVARGLDHAHTRGVLHRDVKPANILIGSDGRARLTDFGLAKLSDVSLSLTNEGDIIGTPVFMSPEQIKGDVRSTGPGLDVWAVGVILYVVLTRGLPFRGRTVEEVSDAVIRLEPPPPTEVDSSIPVDLERICLCALRKDHRQRYRSAAELARDLDAYLKGGQVLAGTVTMGVRARRATRLVRLHGAAFAALFVVVLLVGAGVGAKAYFDARRAEIVIGKQEEAIRLLVAETKTNLARADAALGQFEVEQAQDALDKARRSLSRGLEIRPAHGSETGLDALSAEMEVLRARVTVASSNNPDEPALAVLQAAFAAGDLKSGRWALDHATRLEGEVEWAESLPDPTGIPEEDGPRAEVLLELRIALDGRQGRARSWEPLLTRSSKTALGRAARLHEALWLIEREHFEAARRVLWAADKLGQAAPLLHARLLRAVQRDDPETYSIESKDGWESIHSRLVEQAREEALVQADLATAELAVLRGELRRARAVLAPWLKDRLAAGMASEVRALDLTALSLQDEARARDEAAKLVRQPGLHPRARARLAWMVPDAALDSDLSEEALLAGLADRIDAALGQLVLRSLGGALESKALVELAGTTPPTLPTSLQGFGPDDIRAEHLGLRARVALIQLSAGHKTSAQDLLKRGLTQADLAHPELSLARRLVEDAPLELPVAPWWAPPPGLVLGRRWTARYEALLGSASQAERAFKRAKSALHLAIRHAPADPYVRLARARLRLLRAAHATIDSRRAREGALRDASLAVAIAPDLNSARRTFFYAAWALDEATLPQILSRSQGDWRVELHPADRLTLQLLEDQTMPPGSPWYVSLGQARRELLRRAAGGEARAVSIRPEADLKEALASAGEADRAPIEGELLLRDPRWLAEHLAGRCPAKSGCALNDDQALAWATAEDAKKGPLATPAQAFLLVSAIRQAEPAGRGRPWLEALWRDHGGPGCLRLEVAWVLWTRPAGQRILLADLEPLPGKDDALAHLLAALIAKSGKPRDPLTAELWSTLKRWH